MSSDSKELATTGLIHSWLRNIRVAFVPGPTTPLLQEVTDRLSDSFRRQGHEIQQTPDDSTDVILTTALFGDPVGWREPAPARPGSDAPPLTIPPSDSLPGLAAPDLQRAAQHARPSAAQALSGHDGSGVYAPASAHAPVRATFSLVLQDFAGTVLQILALGAGRTYLGRLEGDLLCPDDPAMSPLHARFHLTEDGRLLVRDLKSTNGTYLRCRDQVDLRDGDRFLVGSQVFSFHDTWPPAGNDADEGTAWLAPAGLAVPHRVVAHGPGDAPIHVHLLEGDWDIGRHVDAPWRDDERMARLHAVVVVTADGTHLRERPGTRGIFLRLRDEAELRDGDVLVIGSLLFQVRGVA